MIDWHGHGRTGLTVGFGQQGYFHEAGHCFHLRFGSPAFGYASRKENGRITMHLKCESCYKDFITARNSETVVCQDCNRPMPRSNTTVYTPYDLGGMAEEEASLIICSACTHEDKHLARLALDVDAQMDDADGDPDSWDPGTGLACDEEDLPPEIYLECSDCGGEFPPAALQKFVPADVGEGSVEEQTLLICQDCREEPQHVARLRNNHLDRESVISRKEWE